MRKLITLMIGAVFAVAASAVNAATLITDGSGRLTGANGVSIDGRFFDVTFVDGGNCADRFSGCNPGQPDDFDFLTSAAAFSAGTALLEQVFVDGAQLFDSNPSLTLGCSAGVCQVWIPFPGTGSNVGVARAINFSGQQPDFVFLENNLSRGFAYGDSDQSVWARFAVSNSAVPEPAAWIMMLLGFFGVGGAMRHASGKKKSLFSISRNVQAGSGSLLGFP